MKHILITGGTDGIGKAAAGKFTAAGYKVTVLGRDEAKSKAVAEELGCTSVVADVTDFAKVESAVRWAVDQNGPIDILLNNAGLWIEGPLDATPEADIKKVIDVNVTGAINVARAVVPGMKAQNSGRIINVSSQAGLYGRPERSVYVASKWAITGFTKSLHDELKPFGIAVSGLYPGKVDTKLFDKAGTPKDMGNAVGVDAVADTILYMCNLPDGVYISEVGIQSLDQQGGA